MPVAFAHVRSQCQKFTLFQIRCDVLLAVANSFAVWNNHGYFVVCAVRHRLHASSWYHRIRDLHLVFATVFNVNRGKIVWKGYTTCWRYTGLVCEIQDKNFPRQRSVFLFFEHSNFLLHLICGETHREFGSKTQRLQRFTCFASEEKTARVVNSNAPKSDNETIKEHTIRIRTQRFTSLRNGSSINLRKALQNSNRRLASHFVWQVYRCQRKRNYVLRYCCGQFGICVFLKFTCYRWMMRLLCKCHSDLLSKCWHFTISRLLSLFNCVLHSNAVECCVAVVVYHSASTAIKLFIIYESVTPFHSVHCT